MELMSSTNGTLQGLPKPGHRFREAGNQSSGGADAGFWETIGRPTSGSVFYRHLIRGYFAHPGIERRPRCCLAGGTIADIHLYILYNYNKDVLQPQHKSLDDALIVKFS